MPLDKVGSASTEVRHRRVVGQVLGVDRPDVASLIGGAEKDRIVGKRLGEQHRRFEQDALPALSGGFDREPVALVDAHHPRVNPAAGQRFGVLSKVRGPFGSGHGQHRVGVQHEVQWHRR